jgi:hypothetical protein
LEELTMTKTVTVMQDGKPQLIDLDAYVRDAVARAMPKAPVVPADGKKPKAAKPGDMMAVGQGVQYYMDGDKLVLVVDIGPDAYAKAPLSHGRKNVLVASSKGNPLIENPVIPGLRLALNVYAPHTDD